MKTTKITFYLFLVLAINFIGNNRAFAQDGVPTEVKAIVKMKLEDGEEKLEKLGYEICFSSLFGKKQDWVNEKSQTCVTLKFNKKQEITEVSLNPETSECLKKLEKARKIWENYHDGQAPVSNSKIDEERKNLADKGFKVSYWINDVSPGRSAEYWVNDSTKKVKLIVWESADNKWVMTNDSTYEMGKNPAPKKN